MILHIRFRTLLLPALMSLAAVHALHGQADVVTPRFDWPVGTVATVELERIDFMSTPTKIDTVRTRISFRLHVLEHPEGRLIRTDSFRSPALSAKAGSRPSATVGELFRYIRTLWPTFVVNDRGKLVRIEDIERLRGELDSLFMPLFSKEGFTDEAVTMLDTILSERNLTGLLSKDWNTIVGSWTGSELTIGNIYSFEMKSSSPFSPDVTVPMTGRVMAAKRIPCAAGDSTGGCVELRMRSWLDSLALRKTLLEFADRVAGEQAAELIEAVNSMKLDHDVTLITDPDTMLPRSLSDLKAARMNMTGTTDEPGGEYYLEELRTFRFTYDDR